MLNDSNSNKSEIEAAFDVIYNCQAKYYAELRERLLSEGFLPQSYLEKDSVMRILEYSIRYFTDMFEKLCLST